MLALVATIVGSAIAGYSAYKIHIARTGQDRKLRDMEVLRRLNIPPKKQVRVWSFLMVLGLVLLTPGLGFLLSYDPVSGDAAYSNLRSIPSGNPMVVPPSERLDNTPRIVDKDESSRTVFFASSGGSSKRSSSGGGGTKSVSSSSENATSVDETSSKGYDNDTLFSGGDGSTYYVSEINETAEISETGPTFTETLTDSGKIDTVPEKTSVGGASEPPEIGGETEPILTETSAGPVVIDAATEISAALGASGSSVSENVPKSTETLAESAIIDAASEKRTATDVVGHLAAGTEPVSTSAETSTEPVVFDAGSEERRVSYTSGYSVDETEPLSTSAETSTEPEVVDIESEKGNSAAETKSASTLSDTFTEPVAVNAEPEKSTVLETYSSSEIGDEFESPSPATSSEPSDSEVESDLPVTSPSSAASDLVEEPDLAWLSSAIEISATGGISDQAAVPAAKTEPQIDEVKKLEFKENPTSETNSTGNDSGDGTEPAANLLLDLDGPFGDFETGPRLDTFGKGFDFDTEFKNFASTSQSGMGIDNNDTSSPVSIMQFEKIDLGSTSRGGFGLTPTSPFG